MDADLLLGGDSEAQMKQAFIEFYKLFDDFGIIDKTHYLNINNEIKVWINNKKTNIKDDSDNVSLRPSYEKKSTWFFWYGFLMCRILMDLSTSYILNVVLNNVFVSFDNLSLLKL